MKQLDDDHGFRLGDVYVTLDHLDQQRTYNGLLEGNPTARMNDGRIEGALQRARALRPGAEPHLLAPTRRDYFRTPGDGVAASNAFGPVELLPGVTCVAVLRADWHAELPVVWFQEHYAMPIADEAFAALRALPWTTLATVIDYW